VVLLEALMVAKFIVALVVFGAALPVWAGLNIQSWVTAQGAHVVFVENHDLPMLDLTVDFSAGSARDASATSGLASLTRHMMQQGAGDYSERDIAERLADVGAVLSGRFDADKAGFQLRTLSGKNDRDVGLQILHAVLSAPRFDADILEREKSRLARALQEAETKPEKIGDKAFMRALYGTHPYALPDAGEPETVTKLTREQLQNFYRTYYRANNMTIALMGDISRAEAEQIASQLASGLPEGEAPDPIPPVLPASAVAAGLKAGAEGSMQILPHHASQSHLFIGLPGLTRHDPDYFPLLVGNYILGGGGFDSRLMDAVRQKKGLAYSVYSYFSPMQELGPFQIGLQTRRDATDEALTTVQEELMRYLASGPTDKELTQAKNNMVGGFPLRLDSNKKIIEYLAVIGFYRLPLNWLETYTVQVEAVTREEILRAFRARVQPAQLRTVVVGGQLAAGKD
jgi:zinc protease